MSIVVEQTLPYTHSQLKLDDPTRWSRLFPLMRPSVKTIELEDGQTFILDTALKTSKNVLIVAIGSVGKLSSIILKESHVAAFASETSTGKISLGAEEIVNALEENGFPVENGVVVVRGNDTKHTVRKQLKPGCKTLELLVAGDMMFDHALSLLAAVNSKTKSSLAEVEQLLFKFTKSPAMTRSTFHNLKLGNAPSIACNSDIAEFESAKVSLTKDLDQVMSSLPATGSDEVYSIHCSDSNGLSRLENNIIAHEIFEYFAKRNLQSYITHSTSTDNDSPARGWAISISLIPSRYLTAQDPPTNPLNHTIGQASTPTPRTETSKVVFSDPQARKIITAGCEAVIKAEPIITEYDTIVGDGDCGYTLRDGAKQVLSFISTADLSLLPSTLSALVDDLEVNMGGTSGALYCIFLSSLAQELYSASTFAEALKGALEHLLRYTRARLGDRTCLDCLIPFVETLKESGDARKALGDAEKGVEGTKRMEAKLGRSSYLDEAATRGVPDPGAYGLLVLLEGMVGAE